MALPYIIGSTVFSILGGISLKMYNNNNSHTINTTNLNDSIDYSLVDYNLKEITVSSNKSPSLGITFAQKCQAITNLCKSKCGFDPNHKYCDKWLSSRIMVPQMVDHSQQRDIVLEKYKKCRS